MAKMQRTSWPATKGAAVPSDFFPWECEQRDPPGSGQVVMSGSTCELKLSGADSGSSLGKPGGEVGARSDEQVSRSAMRSGRGPHKPGSMSSLLGFRWSPFQVSLRTATSPSLGPWPLLYVPTPDQRTL